MSSQISGYEPAMYGLPHRFDPYFSFISMVPFMVDLARDTAKDDSQTYSYRDFRVGAVLMAMIEGTNEVGVFSHGNLKKQSHLDKICAERKALQRAERAGFTKAIGFVVAGTSDRDAIAEVSMRPTATLHPCAECRHRFDENPLVRPETLVVSTGLSEDIYQVHTVDELTIFYADSDEAPEAAVAKLDFDNWSLRQANYGHLRASEATLPPAERRSDSQLARMALAATFIQ